MKYCSQGDGTFQLSAVRRGDVPSRRKVQLGVVHRFRVQHRSEHCNPKQSSVGKCIQEQYSAGQRSVSYDGACR